MLADACHTDLVSAQDDSDLPAISAYHRVGNLGAPNLGAGEQQRSQLKLFAQPELFVKSGLSFDPEISASVTASTASHVTLLAWQV